MKTLRLLLLIASLALTAGVSAQTVGFLIVDHRHSYTQTDNTTVVDVANPWEFRAAVEGTTDISGITAPTLTKPSGTGSTTMTYDSGENAWFVENAYPTSGDLLLAYGDGNYSLTALGQTVTPISVTGDSFPTAPMATNLSGGTIVAGVLSWNVANSLTITITGVADHMGIFVNGSSYNDGTEVFGAGSHTFTVPALSLTPGYSYSVELMFDDIVGGTNVTSIGSGALSGASYAGIYSSQTKFTIQAIPEPSTYAAIFGGLALAGVMIHRRRRAA